MNFPKVSIVVTTKDEEKDIGILLKSCLAQSYKNIEVVLVDSPKTKDKTREVAGRFIKNIYTYGSERSLQRNFGVKMARGKYVLIVDADMKLEKDVVKECVEALESDKLVKGIIIPEKTYGSTYWAYCKALERRCYLNDPTIEAERFFPRKIFLKVGGYNEKMVAGEDFDLARKVRKLDKTGRIKSYIHHNEGNLTLIDDLKKKFYYARYSDEYMKENVAGLGDILLYLFRPAYFRNYKILLSDPVHLPGFILMKFLEFTVSGLGSVFYKKNFWARVTKV